MESLSTRQSHALQRLDAQTAARVLARAARTRASADLWIDGEGVDFSYNGKIEGAADSYLLVAVGPAAGALLGSSIIHVDFELGGSVYAFDTRCADEFAGIEPGVVRLVRPTQVDVTDRRRSTRRRFHEGTEIRLRPLASNTSWTGRARLLNLSTEGLACRVGTSDARGLAVGAAVQVDFRIDAASLAFCLNARVITATRGGTAEHVVLGLEFTADELLMNCREQLRTALEATD